MDLVEEVHIVQLIQEFTKYIYIYIYIAYTARSLVGMIYNVGLLPEVNLERSREAYERYRDRFEYDHPNQIRSTRFREEYQCKMPLIHFLGCFDTVGALGVPKLPWYLGGSTCKPLYKYDTLQTFDFFILYICTSVWSVLKFTRISRHQIIANY